MLVASLVRLAQKEKLSPLQRRLLSIVEERSDEVFENRDEQLAREAGGKPSSIAFSLWALHKKGLIDKEVVAGRVYFGSKAAIAGLRAKLGIPSRDGDPFERATRNLERIRARVGTIDGLTLLDAVREGR